MAEQDTPKQPEKKAFLREKTAEGIAHPPEEKTFGSEAENLWRPRK